MLQLARMAKHASHQFLRGALLQWVSYADQSDCALLLFSLLLDRFVLQTTDRLCGAVSRRSPAGRSGADNVSYSLFVCLFVYLFVCLHAVFSYPESFHHSEMLPSCKDTHSKLHNLSTVMNHLIYFSQVISLLFIEQLCDSSIFRHI